MSGKNEVVMAALADLILKLAISEIQAREIQVFAEESADITIKGVVVNIPDALREMVEWYGEVIELVDRETDNDLIRSDEDE